MSFPCPKSLLGFAASADWTTGQWTAEGAAKATSRRSPSNFRSVFTAAPQISPIVFSDKIHEGMRAMASCNIIDGDPPMRVSWWKNGQPLHDGLDGGNVQVSNPSEYSSFLTIKNVTRSYTGNYTCVANNNAAVSNFTAMLLVKGKTAETEREGGNGGMGRRGGGFGDDRWQSSVEAGKKDAN